MMKTYFVNRMKRSDDSVAVWTAKDAETAAKAMQATGWQANRDTYIVVMDTDGEERAWDFGGC